MVLLLCGEQWGVTGGIDEVCTEGVYWATHGACCRSSLESLRAAATAAAAGPPTTAPAPVLRRIKGGGGCLI